jgi:hypothetical protein
LIFAEELSQSAQLEAYHRDKDPGGGAGFGVFVIANQPPMTHKPAEGAFHHPPPWQYFKASQSVGAFDDLYCQLGPKVLTHWANASPL